jgi:hypothetical protein
MAEENTATKPQVQANKPGTEPHFPFSSAGELARTDWPSTALSFAPEVSLGPN